MVLPYQLRFLPAMSSRIAVLSSLGQVNLLRSFSIIKWPFHRIPYYSITAWDSMVYVN